MNVATGRKRLIRALHRHGPVQLARLCLLNVRLLLNGKAGQHRYVHDDSWDKAHGVDTAGTVEMDEITALEHEKIGAVRYEPTPPDCFTYLIAQARLRQDADYTFIDIGSGKGRVVLLAALAGFRRAIGIELGQELHETACRNIAAMRKSADLGEVESIRADATSYSFPDGPTVCFLNNPFEAQVLDRLLVRIEASLAASPRLFTIIYYHSNHADRLASREGWRRVADGAWRDESHHFSIFEWSEARPH